MQLSAHYAIVHAVILEEKRRGVLVAYRDGVVFPEAGTAFVRVLQRRAHPHGGSKSEFPQIGEIGLVLEVDEGKAVWLGSLDAQEANQGPLDEFMDYYRHESGFRRTLAANGDFQLEHPSGTVLRITEGEAKLPVPETSSVPQQVVTDPPFVELEHPKAGKFTIKPDGTFTFAHASGGTLQVTPDGDATWEGFASSMFEGGAARFCMEDLWTWVKTHTHSGVTAGGGVTGAPVTQPPDSSLTPDTFKGPSA